MISGKALLVSVPLVVAGGILMAGAHLRVGALRSELSTTDAQGRAEGESYLRTLQGAHAQRQLDLLTQHHDVALRLASARRDRLLGLVTALGGLLAFAIVRAVQRVGLEIEEAGRLPGTTGADGASDERAATRSRG